MVLKCKMCGADLALPEDGSQVCECEYCGTRQTVPSADSEKKTNLFNRANRLRMNSEFDKACAIYEQIVAEFPEEAEAYWGLCLCNYGIEYVDDPATGKKLPTCHRTLPASIMEDGNFEQACDLADAVARRVYRDEAKAIDRIQKDILSIAANEAPYDVFICYKETDDSGDRTEDSVLAQEIYDSLTEKGLKVFFSRITLEDKLGVQYEPYIYAALSSAKVMLAVGTKFEYYDAVWVKNEWSRFLGMMKSDRTKTLIPCFRDLDAYDMPKEFKGLQAQDMGKLGWKQDLVRGVEKLCGKGTAAPQQTVVREVVRENAGNAANLMKRVYLFLEDQDWKQAAEYIDKVLDQDAEYAPAYVAKVLVRWKLKNEGALAGLCGEEYYPENDADWQKAVRFADETQKKTYAAYAKAIRDKTERARIAAEKKAEEARIAAEKKAKQDKYNAAVALMESRTYPTAILAFNDLGDYADSKARLRECIDAYRPLVIAGKGRDGKADGRLVAAQQKVREAEQAVKQAEQDLAKAEKRKEEAVQREKNIPGEIREVTEALSRVHGLFSGWKKQELESRIEELQRELKDAKAKQLKADETIAAAKADLKDAEDVLEAVQKKLQENVSVIMTDEAVISAAKAYVARFGIGKMVMLGTYAGKKIEWIVLAANGDDRVLIAKYGIEAKAYNTENTHVTWETCSLRKWLNGEFYQTAFTGEEKKLIALTEVRNDDNARYKTRGGNDTRDHVYLLSIDEANRYFSNYAARVCSPTVHAKESGTWTNSDTGAGWWWLRSPGSYGSSAADVDYFGNVSVYGFDVRHADGCVRPVVVARLSNF